MSEQAWCLRGEPIAVWLSEIILQPFKTSLNVKEHTLALSSMSAVISMSGSPEHLTSRLFNSFCFLLFSLGVWSCFCAAPTCYLPNHYYFPLLSLLAFTRHSLPLRSLRTSASWLCLSLISFCQAFVFDHHLSVSSLLLLLSTSSPPSPHFWFPAGTSLRLCVCVCTCVCIFGCLMQNLYGQSGICVSEVVCAISVSVCLNRCLMVCGW